MRASLVAAALLFFGGATHAERAGFAQALSAVRAAPEDLDLRPDLWDGPLKTTLVETVLSSPASLETRAGELAARLSASTGAAVLSLGADGLALSLDTATAPAVPCPELPALAPIASALKRAQTEVGDAAKSLARAERQAAYELAAGPVLNEDFRRVPDGAYAKLAAFDPAPFVSAARALAAAIDTALPEVSQASPPEKAARCGGALILPKGDFGVSAAQLDGASLVLNLSGSKRYLDPMAAAGPGQVRVLIDLGAPSFSPSTAPALGSGVFGVGLAYLPHLPSGARIETGDFSLGAGFFGAGAAFLRGEGLVLSSRRFSQGAGAFGVGALSVEGDGGSLEARFSSQGFGFTRGAGLLRVKSGGAVLRCGLFYADPHEPVAFSSFCQGAGLGPRAFAGGGVGAASVEGVAAQLDSGYFSQGAGYWHGLGVLSVASDGARLKARRYTQGSGIHSAAGALLVKGSLIKTASWGVGPGFGWDDGAGYFSIDGSDGLFQADWATGRAEYGSDAMVRVTGDRNRLSLPGLGSGTFKRSAASWSAAIIDGTDNRLWVPGLSSATASGSLRLPTPWGVVLASGTTALQPGVGPEPQDWPKADREAQTRREHEGLGPLREALAQGPDVENALFAASAAGFDGATADAGIRFLLELAPRRAEELVAATDPDRFDESLWLRLTAAALGAPATEAAGWRELTAKGRLKASYLDLHRFGPARSAVPWALKALGDSDVRVRRTAVSVLSSLLGRQPGEEPGRLVQLQASIAWLASSGSSETLVSGVGLVRLPELYSFLALGAPVLPADRATLLRIAGNPFDSVSPQTVAAYGEILARDRQARRAALSRELSDARELAESVLDALLPLLSDKDPWMRASALTALGQIGERTEPLAKALADPAACARQAAASALGRMGTTGLPALEKALDAKEPGLRALAVTGLAQSPETRAVPALVKALRDEDENVRLTAVAAPAALQPALAGAKADFVPELRRLAKSDPSLSVRAAAAAAIASIAPAK